MHKILTINPGSTSTKIGVFFDRDMVEDITIRHDSEELKKFSKISDQFAFRKELVIKALVNREYNLKDFSAIGCRGGTAKIVSSGIYNVDENMVECCRNSQTDHPSNLAAMIGYELANEYNIKAYVTDPAATFEGEDMATISGHPLFKRTCRLHALNQKAVAKMHCEKVGLEYKKADLVVAHIGGGISIGIHKKGVVVDTTDPMNDGPFSPERSGTLPTFQLLDLCFSGEYTRNELKHMLSREAGYKAHLGTNDTRKIREMVDSGDKKAILIYRAFVYQIAKSIAAMSVNVNGKVDGILITGGVAYDKQFVEDVTKRVEFIAKVYAYPGEMELQALAYGALEVITGKEEAKTY